jgi:hypothetical protein
MTMTKVTERREAPETGYSSMKRDVVSRSHRIFSISVVIVECDAGLPP